MLPFGVPELRTSGQPLLRRTRVLSGWPIVVGYKKGEKPTQPGSTTGLVQSERRPIFQLFCCHALRLALVVVFVPAFSVNFGVEVRRACLFVLRKEF